MMKKEKGHMRKHAALQCATLSGEDTQLVDLIKWKGKMMKKNIRLPSRLHG
jgi:hypothetical protein